MSEEIPTARPAGEGDEAPRPAPPVSSTAPVSPPAGIDAKPLLELEGDSCPKCGALMDGEAVVCGRCGYDLKTNTTPPPPVALEIEREREREKVEAARAVDEFVRPGGPSPKALAIAGAVLTVGAMVAAGIASPAGAGGLLVVALVLLAAYNTIVHACTGTAAVALAAKLSGERFTLGELPLARMFVAYAAFELCRNIPVPIGVRLLEFVVAWGLGVAAYLGAVWWLFRRDRDTTLLIAGCHAGIWLVLQVGLELARWAAASAGALAK